MSDRATPPESSSGRPIGWAVVGLGAVATERILPAFARSRRSRLAALVSGSSDKMQQLGERHGLGARHLYDYAALERLRDDPTVDAVYIALPSAMHAEFTVRAARAGKHVLCEAPMAASVEDATAMVNVCRTAGRLLMVAHRASFAPTHHAALAALRAGQVGALKTIVTSHTRRLDPSDRWRSRRDMSGGGSLIHVGLDGLRAARELTGEEPVEVSAMVHAPGNPPFAEIEESASWMLRFPGGALATGTTSLDGERVEQVLVQGSHGRLAIDQGLDQQRLRIERGVEQAERTVASEDLFALVMDHLAQCILERQTPRTSGDDALRDMHLLDALYESARTGERVALDPATGVRITRAVPRPSMAPPAGRASMIPPRPPSGPGRQGTT